MNILFRTASDISKNQFNNSTNSQEYRAISHSKATFCGGVVFNNFASMRKAIESDMIELGQSEAPSVAKRMTRRICSQLKPVIDRFRQANWNCPRTLHLSIYKPVGQKVHWITANIEDKSQIMGSDFNKIAQLPSLSEDCSFIKDLCTWTP